MPKTFWAMEKFSSQRMTQLATEEKNDDFSAKARLKRRNHRFTDVNCSREIKNSALLPEKPWINPRKK